jgi:hypothetical protein
MIRIDENTYFDETLVTCAEYQLFIDEMRGQGKYYQPDHWNSYQFPSGKAREPILGVRFGDAEDLCRWLSKRDADEWYFHLPTNALSIQYPLLKPPFQIPLGYWTVADDDGHIAWIGPEPTSPRNLDLEKVLAVVFNGHRNSVRSFASSSLYDVETDGQTSAQKFVHYIDKRIDLVRNQARNTYHQYFLDLALARNQLINLAHTKGSKLDDLFLNDLNNLLNRDLDQYHAIRKFALERAYEFTLNNILYKDIYFALFFDLYTFRERIAGRSPAFEGIRLVKERVK